jgi:hypothetical protein
MSMIPPILLAKLTQLRQRERLLRLAWGGARLVSLVLSVFILACLLDWLVDMWDETPWGLREFMFGAQAVLAGVAIFWFLLVPQLRRLRYEKLALLVESKRPELQHRLISALELNRPGAHTEGMSQEMLAAMTREAQEQALPIDFREVADHGRLKSGLKLVVPVLAVALILVLLDPAAAAALVRRQFLADVDIPRAVSVTSIAHEVWPSGEQALLKFRVHGPGVAAGRSGSLRVRDNDGNSFSVPLTVQEAVGSDGAIYVAPVPPGNVDFSYMAKVADGRTRQPGQVFYVPRPTIIKQDAFVLLPTYLGTKSDGTPYEQKQARGDVLGMPGLMARVTIKTQKPIVDAILQTYGSPHDDMSGPSGLTRHHDLRARLLAGLSAHLLRPVAQEPFTGLCAAAAQVTTVPLRRLPMPASETPTDQVEWVFDLRPTETSYRITVFDEYGFSSKTETVRTIRVDPEPAPVVVLHPESFPGGAGADFQGKSRAAQIMDFEGMPLPLVDEGKPGPLPISFEAYGPYGIGKARLIVKVIRGANDSEGDTKKEKLEHSVILDLAEVKPTNRVFDKTKGAFVDSSDTESILFYAVPSPKPNEVWSRMVAGGRFDYFPSGILNDDGKPFVFKPEDQIVVYVEVFNRNPDPAKALMGKSRLREKEIVPMERFERWCFDTLQEASRIETLMYMQQQVYDRPWLSIFGWK